MSGTSMSKRRVVVWPQGDVVRRVVLDGVEVVLERRAGVWAVADVDALASETALLETLGQPNDALGRARGVAEALNAQLVRPDQLSDLVCRLAWLWIRRPYGYWHLAFDERDALAAACAHLGGDAAFEFLAWVLAKRLEPAWGRTPWMPPGWHNWNGEARWEFDSGIAQRLGEGFFDAMAAHADRRFANLAVASDPDADPERLGGLAADGDRHLRDLMAVNPSTPIETLKSLSIGPIRSFDGGCVRLRVLQNPSAPAWLVAEAATAPVADFYANRGWHQGRVEVFQRVWGAMHPRAPMALLRDLASHSDPTVRAAVAANPAGPPGALRRLAGDTVTAVRREAATNESTPPETLHVLCDDADVLAAAAAAANPGTDRTDMAPVAERLARSDAWLARAIAADLPETPAAVLGLLAADPHRDVREAAAGNPRTPPQALWALARRSEADQDLAILLEMLDNDALDWDLRCWTADACVALSGPPPQRYMTAPDQRRWAQR